MTVIPIVLVFGGVAVAWASQLAVIRRIQSYHPSLWEKCGRPGYFLPGSAGNWDGPRRLLWKEDLRPLGDRALWLLVRSYRLSVLAVALGLLSAALIPIVVHVL